jgi:hypothetical protein
MTVFRSWEKLYAVVKLCRDGAKPTSTIQYCLGLVMTVLLLMGRLPLIAVENIPKLNEKALEVVGRTQGNGNLSRSMQNLIAEDRDDRGLPLQLRPNQTFAQHTLARYNALALLPPGIACVKSSSAQTQGIRKQMANFLRGTFFQTLQTLAISCVGSGKTSQKIFQKDLD